MAEFPRFQYDVLVIGAGGAGLRAAIEASAGGVTVGVVSKSLLGKAHTVMAEGGVAAALANVDDRDSWKVHFADTMRGGQYLNNPRMAELHAKEAPDRVRELEAWGALFDRTKDGRILQRNFGGHRYPRLAHVGDRTGLEMIRTLQDHGIHQGIEFHMEHTVTALLKDGDRVAGAFGYERERGRFLVWEAKAVILATGGIGRAYSITSNSWEYTGDGHALAYDAGAELMDMEFVQFHPTGMVWPPSVRGILVTEGVRGEGGVLRNSEGRRFMFDDIPPHYKEQTADNEEEGWRYCQGDKEARRPPELLTRDHVARCIVREIREGRGSPHGGVFLDIAWIKRAHPQRRGAHQEEAPQHVPPVQAAGGHRHHQGADGGGPDHALHDGRRAGATPRPRCPPCPASSPPASAAPACTAPTASAATRSRTCWSSASGRASTRRRFARENGAGQVDEAQVEAAAKGRFEPFDRMGGENPYQLQHELQAMMQDLVGIVREEAEMQRALEGIERLRERMRRVGVAGNREYNPGWHTALDLPNLLTVSEAITRAALERRESRGAHFRDDYPEKDGAFGKVNVVVRKGADGEMQIRQEPIPAMSPELQGDHRGDEVMARATFRIWRGDRGGGELRGLRDRGRRGHGGARRRAPDPGRVGAATSPCAGTARPASAAPARPRSTASAADVHDAPERPAARRAGHRRADEGLPGDPGPGDRRLLELRGQEEDQAVQAAAARRRRRHLADGAGGRRPRAGVPQVHRVLPLPGRLPRAARPPPARRVHRSAAPGLRRRPGDAPARRRGPHRRAAGSARHRLLQHHQVLHQGLPGGHHHHRQRHHPA